MQRNDPTLAYPEHPDSFLWVSEFGSQDRGDALPARAHVSPDPADHAAPYSHESSSWWNNEQSDTKARLLRGHLNTPLPSTIWAHPVGTSDRLISAYQSRDSSLEKATETVDWETLFQSLEPIVKEAGADIVEGTHAQDQKQTTLSPPLISLTEAIHMAHSQSLNRRTVTNYIFQDENPFGNVENPFDEGMRIINDDGNLSFAALAFEAACQSDYTHLEAWRMLGSVQSENEREGAAINAFKEALSLDPKNLDVLIKLAASYTNEGLHSMAYECLEQWLRTKYPHIPVTELESDSELSSDEVFFRRIKKSYIQAAQYSSTNESIDPDVQVGLGVLLFSDQNYQMGADCFASAIHSITPGATNAESQLHLLWNRYGACLGNMGRHEEAIEAYEMALAIRPNFVRARCNLGLLYYNKDEAAIGARNILQALQAYRAGEAKSKQEMMKIVKVGTSHGRLEDLTYGTVPASIYDSLKRCCNSLCRWDLAEVIGPNMNLREFQKELDNL